MLIYCNAIFYADMPVNKKNFVCLRHVLNSFLGISIGTVFQFIDESLRYGYNYLNLHKNNQIYFYSLNCYLFFTQLDNILYCYCQPEMSYHYLFLLIINNQYYLIQ